MRSHHNSIRALLAEENDGLSIKQIAKHIGAAEAAVLTSLSTCFGVYIDRYEGPIRGQWRAIYMLVDVPENAPIPDKRRNNDG